MGQVDRLVPLGVRAPLLLGGEEILARDHATEDVLHGMQMGLVRVGLSVAQPLMGHKVDVAIGVLSVQVELHQKSVLLEPVVRLQVLQAQKLLHWQRIHGKLEAQHLGPPRVASFADRIRCHLKTACHAVRHEEADADERGVTFGQWDHLCKPHVLEHRLSNLGTLALCAVHVCHLAPIVRWGDPRLELR